MLITTNPQIHCCGTTTSKVQSFGIGCKFLLKSYTQGDHSSCWEIQRIGWQWLLCKREMQDIWSFIINNNNKTKRMCYSAFAWIETYSSRGNANAHHKYQAPLAKIYASWAIILQHAATKLPIGQSIVLIVKVSNYVLSKFHAADVVDACLHCLTFNLATTPSIQETWIP